MEYATHGRTEKRTRETRQARHSPTRKVKNDESGHLGLQILTHSEPKEEAGGGSYPSLSRWTSGESPAYSVSRQLNGGST